jgi:lipoyl synthase
MTGLSAEPSKEINMTPRRSRPIHFFRPAFRTYGPETFLETGSCGTTALSITGPECRLLCKHCGASLLRNMKPAVTPEALFRAARGVFECGGRSLLVSGGAEEDGGVPLAPFLATLKEIRSEWGLNVLVHTGLVSSATADGLAEAGIQAALLDVIGHEDTIRQVYHLRASVGDYEESLRRLTERGIPTAPHVIMGLHFGRMKGESQALEIITRYPVKAVVLVGLRPLSSTAMAGVKPPDPETLGGVFALARKMFPQTPVVLGCERPLGRHRQETDILAVRFGLDGIAFPSEQALIFARGEGLEIRTSPDCCALIQSVP